MKKDKACTDILVIIGWSLADYHIMWTLITEYISVLLCTFNPFNPKLIMQILPTIQEENDWVM